MDLKVKSGRFKGVSYKIPWSIIAFGYYSLSLLNVLLGMVQIPISGRLSVGNETFVFLVPSSLPLVGEEVTLSGLGRAYL